MERCVFCEIVAGRAPASIVYDDDHLLAFMDLHPVNPGHLLVIPKQHFRNLYDCPPELAGQVLARSAEIAKALREATGCQGLNVFIANERVAGQEVWHFHLHLLPRYPNDGFGLRTPPGYPRQARRAELDEMAATIREKLRASVSQGKEIQ